ncbi:uncharacterized protein BO88DRAFT_466632, partial [Aspergillus vadensis CBS 113365]
VHGVASYGTGCYLGGHASPRATIIWSPGITLGAGAFFSHQGSFSSACFDNKK